MFSVTAVVVLNGSFAHWEQSHLFLCDHGKVLSSMADVTTDIENVCFVVAIHIHVAEPARQVPELW